MSRRAIKPVSIGIALLALVLTGQAVACGDSLYRVGKGVAYRVYTAPLPGNVLVYGNSEGATELAEALDLSKEDPKIVERYGTGDPTKKIDGNPLVAARVTADPGEAAAAFLS